MLSLDESLLDPASQTTARIKKYAALVDRLEVVVYSSSKKSLKLSDYLTVYSTNTRFKIFYPRQAYRLAKKIIKNKNIDLVTTQDPFETALVGWRLKKKFNIGLNVQVHGDFFGSDYWQTLNLKNKIRFHLAKRLLPKADSIRVVSRRIGLTLKAFGIPVEKITIAPIYVDWHNYQERDSEVDLHFKFTNKFVILSVCRLAAEKNLDLLIKAFNKLSGKYKDLILAIVGAGPQEKKLKLLTDNFGLRDKVFFMGWQEDLVGYYKSADLMVITSASEGYNRTVIEAMACGAPIVMSDVGLAGEILHHGQNGLVYEVGDEEGLIDSIETMLKDVNLRNKFIEAGFMTVQKLPSEEELLKRLYHSWQKALIKKDGQASE
jgi:glycosyltransferase involved in cell wall biosynthesis